MSSELIVITYPALDDATRVVETVWRLQAEHVLDLEDLEYCSRDLDGSIALYESFNHPLAGVALGAFWGTFLGKCFGMPWLCAGLGAAEGARADGRVEPGGIDEGFVRDLRGTLTPGASAVFILVSRYTRGRVMPEIGKFGGTVLHTRLPDEDEKRLQTALDEAYRKSAVQATAEWRV